MKAINKTKQNIIATKVRLANNPITRTVGLLLNSSLPEDEGLLIKPCKSIHSIGMRFLFDAVFIDKNGKVVHLIENMKPLRVSKIVLEAKTVLELSGGVISKTGIELEDIIEFEK